MAEWAKGWIRVYHEIIIDDKMGLLSDHLWRRAIECMIAAGAEGRGGYLPETRALARKLAVLEADLEADLLELAAPGVKILEKRPDGWYVVNHIKRQQARDPNGAVRQDRFRKAQQAKFDALRNASHNGVTDALYNPPRREEDKEEKESKRTSAPPAPSRSSRKAKEPKPVDDTLGHPAVAAYRSVMHLTPNAEQRRIIIDTVTSPDIWQGVLDNWKLHNWSPRSVPEMLEKYRSLNGKPGNGHNLERNDWMDDPQLVAERRARGES